MKFAIKTTILTALLCVSVVKAGLSQHFVNFLLLLYLSQAYTFLGLSIKQAST